jgi:trk system potassium uptake protein TrkH
MGHNVTVRKGRPLNLFMARQKQRTEMLQKMGNQIFLNPPLFLLLGFAAIILLGSIFLSLPFVTQSGHSIGYLNALFTAASASCVTGLTVVNTAKTFNFAGKLIILILIQIGGLGIMTFATLIPMIIGQKIGLVTRQILKEQLNVESLTGIVRLLRYVLTLPSLSKVSG